MNPDTPARSPQSTRASNHYRLDIQGLRGIAVLLVVLFHAHLALFSGGYIGVDVFFVVSGFVIAQVLLRELRKSGQVDLRAFYEKRFRRLLPAATLVSIFTLAASALLLSPTGAQQGAIRTAMAAALFVSNFYLYRGGDYFDPAAEQNPFLHMWSLSVEEQFYFVLPVTMAFVWAWALRRNQQKNAPTSPLRTTMIVVAVGGLLSFVLSFFLVVTPDFFSGIDPDKFGFFAPFTRVWEFAVGVLLALGLPYLPQLNERMARWWAVTGLFFILLAALTFDATTHFPGFAAALPVMGTALLLFVGDKSPAVSRLLSIKPLTWLGNLSYSWYLWHWPLIVLAPVAFPDAGAWLIPFVACASLLPSWLSYTFLEEPIRRNRTIIGLRARLLAIGCIATVLFTGAALSFGASARWGLDIPDDWQQRSLVHQWSCQGLDDRWSPDECRFPAPESPDLPVSRGTILLVGDSNAASLSDAVVEAAHDLGYDAEVRWMPSCPFLKDRPVYRYRDCARWQEWIFATIDTDRPDLVIFSAYPNNYVLSPDYHQDRVISLPDGQKPRSHLEAKDSWAQALDDTLAFLDQRDIKTLVAFPVPFYPYDFTQRLSLLRPDPEVIHLPLDEVRARQATLRHMQEQIIARHKNAASFYPHPYLCPDGRCSNQIDGHWLYMDDYHLNAHGSRRLTPGFRKTIHRLLIDGPTKVVP